jgi:hypothetical protein
LSFERKIFSKIWESPAPSKIVVFSWQLFHNRLPTKDNLFRHGVLDHKVGGNCVWCDSSPGSAKHLFAHCWFGHRVWYEIFKWFGVLMVMPHNLMSLLDCFCASVYNKRSKRGFLLVWHTVVWSIWRARNQGRSPLWAGQGHGPPQNS